MGSILPQVRVDGVMVGSVAAAGRIHRIGGGPVSILVLTGVRTFVEVVVIESQTVDSSNLLMMGGAVQMGRHPSNAQGVLMERRVKQVVDS